MPNRPHKKLDAWKKAIELTVETYRSTARLPAAEKYGLVAQMRRAAVSVASNIAEGAARNTKKEFLRYLYTAQGSLSELDTQAVICLELNYICGSDVDLLSEYLARESRLISGPIKSLKKDI